MEYGSGKMVRFKDGTEIGTVPATRMSRKNVPGVVEMETGMHMIVITRHLYYVKFKTNIMY